MHQFCIFGGCFGIHNAREDFYFTIDIFIGKFFPNFPRGNFSYFFRAKNHVSAIIAPIKISGRDYNVNFGHFGFLSVGPA